ncbi:hypothetical protein RHHCN13_00435 [Rickettsia conorii subsp. heilongjiangensis]|uniref:Lipoprotein n=1 Tax=Rickettsia conorii subsp. heilongjiangensis TaxID=226665 RepID=A0AAD1GHH3_RICCR|nr:hypothetical protein [Rickettsia conorii]AEK74119.1 hypothetical protein Rh054_00470 [Rickettsia conorii subsp. heilongjiangensis 054]BBM90906.1 hypothetical protein RHCH81_00435 [Rickettsia conorii subsp. heilongjiangensis]BBM92115.1 hypothetical protein RHHCN13_00435 [Rickettsia conorii subsp. heilongjiangensis]BBM93324.1 hypothetical protein RHSENDAI29_00435 [Rickettsia conorii subsp. heilongjiangensis]BBM94533.1 hypothetical protein RHSENDAI58_00435 [Rickettsia conorii subsp. heilongjia
MIKKIIFGIAILLSTSCFANSTTSDGSKKDAAKTNNVTTQKIIDDFSTYAGTIKPEVREEIQKYRVAIVKINKKKRELYNSLSKEAQNFLAEQQKYKQKLSISKLPAENDQKNNTANSNDNKSKDTK